MKKRLLAGILAACLLLGLTACGKDAEDGDGRTVYVPRPVAFTTGLQTISECCLVGETIYLAGLPDSNASAPSRILRLSLEGGEVEELPDYAPTGGFSLYHYSTLQAGADGTLWVTERPSNVEYGQALPGRTIPDDGNKGARFDMGLILRQLDADGKELSCFSARMPELEDLVNLGYVYGLLGDGDGQVWVRCERGLAALKDSGEVDFTLPAEDCQVIFLSDGRMAVSRSFQDSAGDINIHLQVVDKEKRGWGETIILPPNAWTVYSGNGEALFYYKTADTICAWRQESGEGEQLLNTIDLGMDENYFPLLAQLEDGRIVLMSGSGYEDASRMALSILEPAEGGKDRKVLTLATLQLTSNLREPIIQFNQASPDYRIVVTDYSQYGGREAAMTRLATEIGAGKMPDILDLYSLPTSRWAANGVLEDLWPYIEGDPELGRDALMERVLQAAEIDGKLYQISQYFWINTLTGPRSAVGERTSWTMDELWEALEKMPEGCVPVSGSRINMLGSLISLDWSRFVDWETSECYFEGEEFKSLLETCAQLPEYAASRGNYLDQAYYNKEIMLLGYGVTGFDFPQLARFLLGDDISFVGYPNEWGKAGSSFILPASVAMSSACKDKEGAWSFLRTLLLSGDDGDSFSGAYFPMNKADFQARAQRLMTPEYQTDRNGEYILDSAGNKVETVTRRESFQGISETLDYHSVTQEDYDQLMALYDATESFTRWDSDLDPIIREVAGAYFAGDKSLEETAALIQNRASLYVNESR